ncbi:MAG: TetR/AcrR family transcriptional regulator [Candidatus Dadabacteria bacterium]|nr:MAG: TetR/AcrR family transcriptional regulator [Candidatus Dadabacteria bacterium]
MTGDSSLRRGAQSRRELTAIAIDCFSRFGFQGTSVERIAREAGVTKGAIYYHFRDKRDLLAAAVADRIAEFEQRVTRACRGVDPEEALRRIGRVCVEHARSDDRPRFILTLLVETIETDPEVAAQLRAMMRRFRAFLRNLIQQGIAQGRFRRDIDAEAVAASYTSSVLGAEIQFYQDPERFAFEESVETAIDHLLEAIRSPRCLAPRSEEDSPLD